MPLLALQQPSHHLLPVATQSHGPLPVSSSLPGICGLEEEKAISPLPTGHQAGGPRGCSVGGGHPHLPVPPAGRPHQEKFVRRKSSRKCGPVGRRGGLGRRRWALELGRSLGALGLHPPPGSRPRPLRSRVETRFPGLAGAAGVQDRAGRAGRQDAERDPRRAGGAPGSGRGVLPAPLRTPRVWVRSSRPRAGSPRPPSARTMAPLCPRPAKRAARESGERRFPPVRP